MKQGSLVQGSEQQKRDLTWWTTISKQKTKLYYWERYEKYLHESLPPNVVRTINTDTDIVMNNIENPTSIRFDRRGMVVGHVQSGKTGNYSALICKATDIGYKFIVVIAGGINNLRNQTQERINESFIGKDGGVQVGVGIGNAPPDKLPISLTTKETDFDKPDADRNAQSTSFDTNTTPVVLVIKKNTNTLSNVINWLNKQYPNKVTEHAMLMIDDESDYASIDTSKPENEPTAINKKIRELLGLFNKSIYVAYTATPYANIFIDHQAENKNVGDDLFPKDFIYALDAPTNYFGARKIFLDSNQKHLIAIDDYLDDIPPKHKKDFDLPAIPKSLYEAVRVFLINIAIRELRGQEDKHNSMLVHATRFTAIHQKFALHLETYLSEIKNDVNSYGKLPDAHSYSNIINDLDNTFRLRYEYLELTSNKYKYLELTSDKVLHKLCDLIESVVVREVHQSTSIPLEYRKDYVTNAIVVGGTSLSRGYTLEGLSVSYFLRNTIYYDTLMQMGRWFGYRPGYEDLCKIYMPKDMIDNFGQIIEATEDLIDDFKRMAEEKMTPNDFGLAIKHHPDSGLQVTARNKLKHTEETYFEMKLDGHAKETACLSSDIEDKKSNLKAIKSIVSKLMVNKYEKIGKEYLWRDIGRECVLKFLDDFKVISFDPFGLKTRMPIDFIKKYVHEVDTLWDVALYSGEGGKYTFSDEVIINKEQRKVLNKGKYYELKNRQISSGSAESIVLTKQQRKNLGSKRKDIRAVMPKPLLMLHIVEASEDSKEPIQIDSELAAFGMSFPGGIKSKNKTIKSIINSVSIKNLLRYENDADD
jgi:hypothetical protein